MRMVELGVLNDYGTAEFREFLDRIREGSDEDPPYGLLEDPEKNAKIHLSTGDKRIDIDQDFEDRIDLADHLNSFIKTDEDVSAVLDNPNAGAWLALAYFKTICARRADGTWKVGKDNRYIPESDVHYTRGMIYRHLVCSALAVYHLHRQRARIMLSTPTTVQSNLMERVVAKKEVLLNGSMIEVIERLYWDDEAGGPKTNCVGGSRPFPDGSLKRLIEGRGSFFEKYRSTYDFWSMDADQILGLLPPEFDEWK